MHEKKVIEILIKNYLFKENTINKLKEFSRELLIYNARYNLISKNTEKSLWIRHILDSAQLLSFINFSSQHNLADLGSGGGFPGLVLAIEPMINLGKKEITQLDDGWTILTKDNLPSAHFEHDVAISREGSPEVLSSFEEIEKVLNNKVKK